MKSHIETAAATISIVTLLAYWLIWETISYVIAARFAPVFRNHGQRRTMPRLGDG